MTDIGCLRSVGLVEEWSSLLVGVRTSLILAVMGVYETSLSVSSAIVRFRRTSVVGRCGVVMAAGEVRDHTVVIFPVRVGGYSRVDEWAT